MRIRRDTTGSSSLRMESRSGLFITRIPRQGRGVEGCGRRGFRSLHSGKMGSRILGRRCRWARCCKSRRTRWELEGADAEVDDEVVDGDFEGEAYFTEAFAPLARPVG